MSSLKDIYWMASPLAVDQRNDLNDKKLRALRPVARYVDPKNEVHVFRKIEHWTLQVDDKCYELSPNLKKKLHIVRKATEMIEPHWIHAKEWTRMRESKQIFPEKRKVGQTSKTHDEIQAEVDYIWTNFNDDWYGFFTQNCQNFTHMLYERIVIDIPEKEKSLWERIPDPIGYRLAEGAQLTLAGRLAQGTKAAYLGAMAQAAPAAEAGQGLTAAGTMSATSAGTASSGTAAVGGTGTAAAGGTTTVGGTATVGGTGTAAAGGSTAAGGSVASGSTAAAGGSVASGSTAAGSTGTAAAATGGTTAGTTTTTAGGGAATSSHVGFGAKAAGLMHGSGHAAAVGGSHAAVLHGGLAKAGVAVALAHPVTGLAITGGLAYLAIRGKRGKRWNRKNPKEEDLDVFDMLAGEEEAFEQAENPDPELEKEVVAQLIEPDQQVDEAEAEALAEELKCTLVTTEPDTIPEERDLVPAVQDARRMQTVA